MDKATTGFIKSLFFIYLWMALILAYVGVFMGLYVQYFME